jgi:hypothetical protein
MFNKKGANKMTLKELQDVLGNNITKVNEDNLEKEETKHRIEIADTTSKLAKQMINNADIILRTDKLGNRHDRIDKVVGDGNC